MFPYLIYRVFFYTGPPLNFNFNFEYFIATYIRYITKGLDQMHNCISRVFTLKYYKIHKYNLNTIQSRIGQKTHKSKVKSVQPLNLKKSLVNVK